MIHMGDIMSTVGGRVFITVGGRNLVGTFKHPQRKTNRERECRASTKTTLIQSTMSRMLIAQIS